MQLQLIAPCQGHRAEHGSYIAEWTAAGEPHFPASADPAGRDFDTWLKDTSDSRSAATCPAGKVPSHTFFLADVTSGRFIGAVNIRHHLNEYLLNIGGHIGYGIRPSERGKGYAKTMLALALDKARELGIERVLVTCVDTNLASARTIMANGGVMEDERVDTDGDVIQRYWIDNRTGERKK